MPYAPTVKAEDGLPEIRQHLAGAGEYLRDLRAGPEDKRPPTYADDLRSAVDFIHMFDSIEKALEAGERAAQAEARTKAEAAAKAKGPTGAFAELEEARISAGREFVAAEGYEEWAAKQRGTFEVEVRTLIDSGVVDPAGGVWRPVGTPYMAAGTARQIRLFIRDVLSVQQTGLASVPYIREVNALTNEAGALMTSEGSAKPEVVMQFTQVDAPIRKIAAWIPATSEILADAPTLRGYIDNRLRYMLMLREEAQVLNGNGTAPNLRGILQTVGVQTRAAVATDLPGTIGLAIGLVENVDGEANFVALNPLDYWAGMTRRQANQFDNGFGGSAPAQQEAFTWGLAAVRTRSMVAGKALVGSSMGATIFEREGVTVRVGDQHNDYFVKNLVAILAEERIGLAVHRPDWFVDTTVTP